MCVELVAPHYTTSSDIYACVQRDYPKINICIGFVRRISCSVSYSSIELRARLTAVTAANRTNFWDKFVAQLNSQLPHAACGFIEQEIDFYRNPFACVTVFRALEIVHSGLWNSNACSSR